MELVDKVLRTFAEYGVKVKPSKCEWFKPQVPFLGHIVGGEGIRKALQYVQQVKDFPKPLTVHQLRQFLGLIILQRKFIPKCSEIAQPLSRLTGGSKRKKLSWTEEMEGAFKRLKEEIEKDITQLSRLFSSGKQDGTLCGCIWIWSWSVLDASTGWRT